MQRSHVVKKDQGQAFELAGDNVVIKVSSDDTGGAYTLMHWTVVAGAAPPPHRHARYDETFYVLRGTLNFLIEDKVVAMTDGDFVRVPAGTRHAYTNNSDATVELLVGMSPGGMEKLFLQAGESETLDLDWYFKEAKEAHQTIYEMG